MSANIPLRHLKRSASLAASRLGHALAADGRIMSGKTWKERAGSWYSECCLCQAWVMVTEGFELEGTALTQVCKGGAR
jgi:hypothetical protein